ncbi:MAG TPA: ATP-binding cassette domain-containing protein [Streptosporangiaceae bacterium]|nr:ATP-binding cassette domain-containing protein [Streptosporangiaceae bacterium]
MKTAIRHQGGTGTVPAVVFRDLVKVYNGRVTALDHASFEIARGETVALLGPNGAGKSTAIDTMLGLRTPTSGQVRVLGMTPAAAAGRRRAARLDGT